MDSLSKRQKTIIIAIIIGLIIAFIAAIVALTYVNNHPGPTDIDTQTAEIYEGPPIANVSGDDFDNFYTLITDHEFNYLRYALGDFLHTKQNISSLQSTVNIVSASQEYKDKQDIVHFNFRVNENDKTYDAMIVRSLDDSSPNRLVITGYDFDVVLSDYVFGDD